MDRGIGRKRSRVMPCTSRGTPNFIPLIDAPESPMDGVAPNVKLCRFFRNGADPGTFS